MSLVNPPSHTLSVVAVVPGNVHVLSLVVSSNVEALSSIVLDVSSGSTVPSDLIINLVSELSDDSSSVDVELLSILVSNHKVSSVEGSDSLGSSIENEPLVVVVWVVPVHSQSELVSTNMLREEQSLVGLESGSDLESNSRGKWLLWIVVSLSVNIPSLVSSVMAFVPDQMSVVLISSSVNVEASHTHISDVSNRS